MPAPPHPDRPRGRGDLRGDMRGSRNRDHFYLVIAAAATLRSAEQELAEAVATALHAGDSWGVIGVALGISRQSAFQRFSKQVGPLAPREKAPPKEDGMTVLPRKPPPERSDYRPNDGGVSAASAHSDRHD